MLKNIYKKYIAGRRALRRYLARSSSRSLIKNDCSAISSFGAAIHETLCNSFSDDERKLINSIEERRASLLQNDETVEFIDYGAGKSTSSRTQAEMDNGVPSSESISRICTFSKPPFWASILFKLVRHLGPTKCLELGTCLGISAAYQSAALKLNGAGELVSLEGSPSIAGVASETLSNMGLQEIASVTVGPFHQTLEEALVSNSPIDFFFNDGHHDYDAVLKYFDQALPHLSPDAVVVFDDISWSDGMQKAWNKIKAHPKVAASVDLGAIGITKLGTKSGAKSDFKIEL